MLNASLQAWSDLRSNFQMPDNPGANRPSTSKASDYSAKLRKGELSDRTLSQGIFIRCWNPVGPPSGALTSQSALAGEPRSRT